MFAMRRGNEAELAAKTAVQKVLPALIQVGRRGEASERRSSL